MIRMVAQAPDQRAAVPPSASTFSRGFLIEMVGNMVVFIICTLVCLQVFASAQASLDRSQAISTLGQESVSLIENWKAGSDLAALAQRFGGEATDGRLTLYFDADCHLTAEPQGARYRLSLSVEQMGPKHDSGRLVLEMGDEVLLDWLVGRYVPNDGVADGP